MRWGRKKSSPSSRRNSIIARVFPISWFSKFKQKGGGDSETNSSMREKLDISTPKGRFYSMDGDEAYWRLSFTEGRRNTGGINPLWRDYDDEFQVPISSFKSADLREMRISRREENGNFNFNDMVLDIKKMKEKQHNGSIRSEIVDKEVEFTNPRTNVAFDRKRRNRVVRGKEEEGLESSKPVERVIFAIEPENSVPTNSEIFNEEVTNAVPEWKNLEEKGYKEIKVKIGSEVKQRNRVKAYSPRTECKIRVLEEMRKARKLKKKKIVAVAEGKRVFDSFAVVKSSFNPYRDFRDSMVEMIVEKGIRSAEDLEELLACYLTLNRDQYHDLIVKVFRQVWFELNGDVCVRKSYLKTLNEYAAKIRIVNTSRPHVLELEQKLHYTIRKNIF